MIQVEPNVCCKICGGALARCYGTHPQAPDPAYGTDHGRDYHLIHRSAQDHDAVVIPLADYAPPVDPAWEAKQQADVDAALRRFHELHG